VGDRDVPAPPFGGEILAWIELEVPALVHYLPLAVASEVERILIRILRFREVLEIP
jgi:hypothetical protein